MTFHTAIQANLIDVLRLIKPIQTAPNEGALRRESTCQTESTAAYSAEQLLVLVPTKFPRREKLED